MSAGPVDPVGPVGSTPSLADRLDEEIRATGPIPVSRYVEAALYDPGLGFYSTAGRAGRDGDFLTAPEVGPLFGAVVARVVDEWWGRLGRPPEFPVVEWGAGPGTLARTVLAAAPEALRAGALVWHAIERSAAQRAAHPVDDAVRSAPTWRGGRVTGVVIANELLDNLPFDHLVRLGERWRVSLVGPRDASGRFTLRPGPAVDEDIAAGLPDAPEGTVVPWQPLACEWLTAARDSLSEGVVIVFDYGATTAELARRDGGWLRTHRSHDGRADWLRDPGTCDITTDVAFDQLHSTHRADTDRSQSDWLRAHGIDDLVAEGRRIWEASAAIGDLAALKARSRIREAEALLDPAGMGGFRVLEWVRG